MKNISKLMAAAAILVLLAGCSAKTDTTAAESAKGAGETVKEEAAQSEMGSSEAEDDEYVAFPYSVDGGRLTVNSVFTFEGFNPDADYAECENCASIELVNNSGQYLAKADITVTLEDETVFHFIVEAVPNEAVIYAFDTDNQNYDESNVVSVDCSAEYNTENLLGDSVNSEEDGTAITLANNTSEDIGVASVYYHDVIDETLFGGRAGVMSIEGIRASDDATVEVANTMMGEVKVCGVIPE